MTIREGMPPRYDLTLARTTRPYTTTATATPKSSPCEMSPAVVTTAASRLCVGARHGPMQQAVGLSLVSTPEGRPSILSRFAADVLHVGSARWLQTAPVQAVAPLAFYGSVEGRAPAYYEIDIARADSEAVEELLRHTRCITALQLPSEGLTPALLDGLMPACEYLECLKLPPTVPAAVEASLNDFVRRVAPLLTTFCMGGASQGASTFPAAWAAQALAHVPAMGCLEYLDISGASLGPLGLWRLRWALRGKQLRAFRACGVWDLDTASVLQLGALRQATFIDVRGTEPTPWLTRVAAAQGWSAAISKLRHLRYLLLPRISLQSPTPDASAVTDALHAQGRDMGLAYLEVDGRVLIRFATDVEATLQDIERLDPEPRLRAYANLDPCLADTGRWVTVPDARWDVLQVKKKGAVYLLREMGALRSMGYEVVVRGCRLDVETDLWGDGVYVMGWRDAGGYTFTLRCPSKDIDAALENQFLSRAIGARRRLDDVCIDVQQFQCLCANLAAGVEVVNFLR